MSSRKPLADAIRILAMDAVQQANSGHPGAPMGMADIAEVLWNDFLRHNPHNPGWANRDRFVLSNGHGSMLLYALLHLSGYALSLDDLKNFRQLHAKTPGHPEIGVTPGVETTTGPLGQGLANAVGMALAERALAAQFNRPGHELIDHHSYAFVGDGCLMEGISHEVCSLAGTQRLGKLIVLYDDNNISIDGEVGAWFGDDTPARFRAYGWQVIAGVDGHDAAAVAAALREARDDAERPSLICCKTTIGFGAPNKAGTAGAHGAPLGDDEIDATRAELGWEYEPFVIPNAVYDGWNAAARGAAAEADWNDRFDAYRADHPGLAAELERRLAARLPDDWAAQADAARRQAEDGAKDLATRAASEAALNAFGPGLPELLGGSADLTGSNNTFWKGSTALGAAAPGGNYIHYGVREFGMCAIMNGVALHGGFIPYGGTFLVFSDYARNAIRMAALMGAGSIFVLTHDSVGLGEDGPTHQPVEHAASLRLIPELHVWRPCDAVETLVAWRAAIERRDGPSCLLLSRQKLAHQPRDETQSAAIARGGYVLADVDGSADAVLIATGSEVELARRVIEKLPRRSLRLVSMPSLEIFDAQDQHYRDDVLPPGVKRFVIEAGVSDGWYRLVGGDGAVFGLDRFGESAPGAQAFEHLGFTPDALAERLDRLL